LSAAGCRATSDPLRNRGDARLVPLRRAANGVGLSSELRWSVTVDNSVFDVCVSHHRHRHGATDPLQHRTGSSFIVIIVIIVILDIIITD